MVGLQGPCKWCAQGARSLVAAEGVMGLYHGLLPTLLRDVPEIAIQFALYERLRRAVAAGRRVEKLRTWEHLILGGISGGSAWPAPYSKPYSALLLGGPARCMKPPVPAAWKPCAGNGLTSVALGHPLIPCCSCCFALWSVGSGAANKPVAPRSSPNARVFLSGVPRGVSSGVYTQPDWEYFFPSEGANRRC